MAHEHEPLQTEDGRDLGPDGEPFRLAEEAAQTADLAAISRILSSFVESGDVRQASRDLLHIALRKTDSVYGFIGATVPGGPQGTVLRVFADEGFNWSQTENRDLYEKVVGDYETRGYIDFPRLDNLFGWPILHVEPIIANHPAADHRASGRQPAGHPPTENFLGVPVLNGKQVVGAIGVANRPGGYDSTQVARLDRFTRAASVIYESYRRMQREHTLIEERVAAEDKLRRANQSLLDLAYVVSHEMQEPLRIMRSQLSLLNVRYASRLGNDADDFISSSLRAARLVERMIDDLWEYARIDRHRTLETVDMNGVFDKTLITLEDVIREKGARISSSALPVVVGERRQLGLVLRQLLSNAILFNRSTPVISFSATPMVDEWQFCMSDNGIGFAASEASEIFKMFRKLDRESPGSGMGLAICQRIIEVHGGRMWAESQPGNGAQFYFTLPFAE